MGGTEQKTALTETSETRSRTMYSPAKWTCFLLVGHFYFMFFVQFGTFAAFLELVCFFISNCRDTAAIEMKQVLEHNGAQHSRAGFNLNQLHRVHREREKNGKAKIPTRTLAKYNCPFIAI